MAKPKNKQKSAKKPTASLPAGKPGKQPSASQPAGKTGKKDSTSQPVGKNVQRGPTSKPERKVPASQSVVKSGEEHQSIPREKAALQQTAIQPSVGCVQLASTTNETAGTEHNLVQLKLSISLLFMLSEHPAIPPSLQSEFDRPLRLIRNDSLTLSLENERSILEAFTLISSSSKDPRKVAAFCIESKRSDGRENYILTMASNHGDLEPLKTRVKQILNLLNHGLPFSDAAYPHLSPSFQLLLDLVVTWNANRILCHIRSRHADWSKTQCKQRKMAQKPVLPALCQFYKDESAFSKVDCTTDTRMLRLRALSDKLESLALVNAKVLPGPTLVFLVDIVRLSYSLWRDEGCERRFRQCSKHWSTIVKLARYSCVVLFLIRHANTSDTFKLMTVQIVKLVPSSQVKLPSSIYSIDSTIGSVLGPEPMLKQDAANRLKKFMPGPSANRDKSFRDLLDVSCAVHAEIQLLYYFESQEASAFPRIIMSTKKPCFLCYLFCQLHGRCHVPRTHGRLYEKWTLPEPPIYKIAEQRKHMDKVARRFRQELRMCIIETLAQRAKRVNTSTESLCLEHSIWTRLSRAASLESLRDAMSKLLAPRRLSPNLNKMKGLLASSEAALVVQTSRSLNLNRDATIAFPIPTSPDKLPTAVKSMHMHMYFSHDVRQAGDEEQRPCHKARAMLATIRCMSEHERSHGASMSNLPSIDISRLIPGNDVECQMRPSYSSNAIELLCKKERIIIRLSQPL